jgi:hypothetical protein
VTLNFSFIDVTYQFLEKIPKVRLFENQKIVPLGPAAAAICAINSGPGGRIAPWGPIIRIITSGGGGRNPPGPWGPIIPIPGPGILIIISGGSAPESCIFCAGAVPFPMSIGTGEASLLPLPLMDPFSSSDDANASIWGSISLIKSTTLGFRWFPPWLISLPINLRQLQ